jgi:hypothetical protein
MSAVPHSIVHRTATRDRPPGTLLASLAICQAGAQGEGGRSVVQFAETLFKNAPEVVGVARAATGVADSTTAGWAAELVRAETRAMFEQDLAALSLWARLASLGLSVPFSGAASVIVPQITVATAGAGAWVGERGAIPLVKGNLSATRVRRFKLAGLVPITKELQRTSDPAALEVVRVLLMQSIANMLDGSLIDASAEVPGVRPAGLLHGVTPGTGATGGGIAAAQADVKTLVGALLAANPGARPALLMNTVEALSLALMARGLGELFGPDAPVPLALVASPLVPVGSVIAVDTASFVSVTDPVEIDTSDEGTIVAADAGAAPPTHAGAAAGGGALGTPGQVVPNGGIPVAGGAGTSTIGASALSLWQAWSTGVRLIMPASFAITRAGAVQALTAITW